MNLNSPLARTVVVPGIILVLAVATFAWLRATRSEARPEPARERVWAVAAERIRPVDVQPPVSAFGEVIAGRVADLRPLVSGRLVEVADELVEGAVVERGTLLAVIDPFEYETAVIEQRAALEEARARLEELRAELQAERRILTEAERQLELRRRELARNEDLAARGTASVQARDSAELAVAAAEQAVAVNRQSAGRLQARITQQQAVATRAEAALGRAERDVAETRLYAPFRGFLAAVDATPGSLVRDGDRIARLIDAGHLEVRFQLPERVFARLLEADDCDPDTRGGDPSADTARTRLRTPARGLAGAPVPGRCSSALVDRPADVHWHTGTHSYTYRARVRRYGAEVDTAGGGVYLYAALDAVGASDPLRPGVFVEVTLPDRLYRDVVRLPRTAVDAGTVYLIDDERLVPRPVEVLRTVGTDVLVRGDLPTGALVATTRLPEAGPGARVQVR